MGMGYFWSKKSKKEVPEMKRLLIICAVFAGVIAGCGIASREIKMKSESKRSDVFSEVREGTPPKGFADLAISSFQGYTSSPRRLPAIFSLFHRESA